MTRQLVFDRLIVCAGLQSERVARLAGDDVDPMIVPFRGEYFRLVASRTNLVRGLIYPVPDPAYPFLGVHFTRRVDDGVDVGPNAVLALAREGYLRRAFRAADMWEMVRYPGFRRLAARHWRWVHESCSARCQRRCPSRTPGASSRSSLSPMSNERRRECAPRPFNPTVRCSTTS
jgi:L-2-hydroxyglutarate oxidase LhgO